MRDDVPHPAARWSIRGVLSASEQSSAGCVAATLANAIRGEFQPLRRVYGPVHGICGGQRTSPTVVLAEVTRQPWQMKQAALSIRWQPNSHSGLAAKPLASCEIHFAAAFHAPNVGGPQFKKVN